MMTNIQASEGVAFAVKSKIIYLVVEELRNSDTSAERIKLPLHSSLKGVERKQQIAKVEECVFYVKAFNK